MPLRPFSRAELEISAKFGLAGIRVAYLQLTPTGRRKSLMDAVAPLRDLLRDAQLHDYQTQGQGELYKVTLPIRYVASSASDRQMTLYRPVTKQGDPRLWITGLSAVSSDNDILAIAVSHGQLVVVNVTELAGMTELPASVAAWLAPAPDLSPVARDLLRRLRALASEPLPAQGTGDTAVGRTVEAALGISANSRKTPDYHGIEIKAFRTSRENRKTLFAQVPDWSLSRLKSSAAILDQFGYVRDGVLKLYNTVSCVIVNSQGMSLTLDTSKGQLIETARCFGEVVRWDMQVLRDRLSEKHRETFWVSIQSNIIGSQEFFQIQGVQHTRDPITSSMEPLLVSGEITVDHLIKRVGGKTSERGPLFKSTMRGLLSLFPPSSYHSFR